MYICFICSFVFDNRPKGTRQEPEIGMTNSLSTFIFYSGISGYFTLE